MIRAQHGSEIAHALGAARHALFIEVVAEQVDAVGAGEIVEGVAVQVGDRDAAGRLHERAGLQMRAHQAAELEWHAVGVGELQVGDRAGYLDGLSDRLRVALAIERGQAEESGAALLGNVRRRIVGVEEAPLVILVERYQRGEQPRHPRVSTERAVLGARQVEPRFELDQRGRGRGGAGRIEGEGRGQRFHRIAVYRNGFSGI